MLVRIFNPFLYFYKVGTERDEFCVRPISPARGGGVRSLSRILSLKEKQISIACPVVENLTTGLALYRACSGSGLI